LRSRRERREISYYRRAGRGPGRHPRRVDDHAAPPDARRPRRADDSGRGRAGPHRPPARGDGERQGAHARLLHASGGRRSGPFIEVNCTALPENLVEAELFGHEKGAFTDAKAARAGLFETADGGTIFLDEIGHVTAPLQ